MALFGSKISLEDYNRERDARSEIEQEYKRYRENTEMSIVGLKRKIDELEMKNIELRDEIEASKRPRRTSTKRMKLAGASYTKPKPFFKKLIVYLYEDDDVFYDQGAFKNKDGEVIALKNGESPLFIRCSFITKFFTKNSPSSMKVENGFYERAINSQVISKSPSKTRPERFNRQHKGRQYACSRITESFFNECKEEMRTYEGGQLNETHIRQHQRLR